MHYWLVFDWVPLGYTKMLVLDTEKLYDVVTQDIVGPYGKTFDWSVKVKMMGRPPPQSSQILVDELKLPITNMQFLEKAKVGFAKAFPTADLMPGLMPGLKVHLLLCAVAVWERTPPGQRGVVLFYHAPPTYPVNCARTVTAGCFPRPPILHMQK